MSEFYNYRLSKLKKREKQIHELSKRNRFYAYEIYKKDPDPTISYGTWIEILSIEMKI